MVYSKTEIETIVNNCANEKQLLNVCEQFKFLIDNKYQLKSLHLSLITHLKLQEFINRM